MASNTVQYLAECLNKTNNILYSMTDKKHQKTGKNQYKSIQTCLSNAKVSKACSCYVCVNIKQ